MESPLRLANIDVPDPLCLSPHGAGDGDKVDFFLVELRLTGKAEFRDEDEVDVVLVGLHLTHKVEFDELHLTSKLELCDRQSRCCYCRILSNSKGGAK